MISITIPSPNASVAIIAVSDDSLSNFKELVFRATNLWPDAPPEIKEFADMFTHGRILQDYKSQAK